MVNSWVRSPAHKTATKPFPASHKRVKNAAILLPVRNTFVAPIFPEPISFKLPNLKILAQISPNGMLHNK